MNWSRSKGWEPLAYSVGYSQSTDSSADDGGNMVVQNHGPENTGQFDREYTASLVKDHCHHKNLIYLSLILNLTDTTENLRYKDGFETNGSRSKLLMVQKYPTYSKYRTSHPSKQI